MTLRTRLYAWLHPHARVTADTLIKPPRQVYDTFDPVLRDATKRKRQHVEHLQRQARRASAGVVACGDVVSLRDGASWRVSR